MAQDTPIAHELSLTELLADPMVRLLMARDGARPQDVAELRRNLDCRGARLRLTATPDLVVPDTPARGRDA